MSKNNSFFLQFLAVKNGTVIPYTKDTGDKLPEIDNTEVTKICSMILGSYGVGFNPYILDFITLQSHLNRNRKLELQIFALSGFMLFLIGFGLCFVSKLSISISLALALAYFFFMFMPKQRKYIAESLYLFFCFVLGKFERKPKTESHEMFNVAVFMTLKLNEYLLSKSTEEYLLFVDELSVNDFIFNITRRLQKRVNIWNKIALCFLPTRHTKTPFYFDENDDAHIEM